MKKKVIVVTSSSRKNANSGILAEQFARGAEEAGHEVVRIDLSGMGLLFCTGCLACQQGAPCPLKDGVAPLLEQIAAADVLAFATPVYYYSVSGRLKTFLDRLNPLFGREVRFRDVYLLTASAEDADEASDGAAVCVEGWVSCFEGVRLAGVVRGRGAEHPGDILKTPWPAAAYAAGARV